MVAGFRSFPSTTHLSFLPSKIALKLLKVGRFKRTVVYALLFVTLAVKIVLFDPRTDLKPQLPHEVPPLLASFSPALLKKFSLGFENANAGFLWVRLLQKASHEPLKEGWVSWEYLQADSITSLDPQFDPAYHFGSIFLTIFRQDKWGTLKLLEKWVRQRPTRWFPRYLLAFHLYEELGDYTRAAEQMLRAADLPGAPPHLAALGVRLLSETGALEHSLRMALQLYEVSEPESERRNRLRLRVRSLNFAVQKLAWEHAIVQFHKSHGHFPQTIAQLESPSRTLSSQPSEEIAKLLGERFPFRYDSSTRQIEPLRTLKELGIDRVGIHRTPRTQEQ